MSPDSPISALAPESLPGELLEMVFDQLSLRTVRGSVSKALLPFVTRHLYNSIKIDYSHFIRLCLVPPRLATLIGSLVIIAERENYGETRFDLPFASHERLIFTRFFRSATALERFDGGQRLRLQTRMLARSVEPRSFESLRSIRLHLDLDWKEGFAQTRMVALFPRLDEVQLVVYEGKLENGFTTEERTFYRKLDASFVGRDAPLLNHSVKILEVEGDVSSSDLVQVVNNLRALTTVKLTGGSHVSLIQAIQNPALVTSLSIRGKDKRFGPTPVESLQLLPFSNLQNITIDTSTLNPDLVDVLAKLDQLTSIILLGSSSPLYSDLHRLLTPKHKPHSLRTLSLPLPFSSFVRSRSRSRTTPWNASSDSAGEWSDGWSAMLASKLLSVARQRDVRIVEEGNWKRAIGTTFDDARLDEWINGALWSEDEDEGFEDSGEESDGEILVQPKVESEDEILVKPKVESDEEDETADDGELREIIDESDDEDLEAMTEN